jgi:hypothetical protein
MARKPTKNIRIFPEDHEILNKLQSSINDDAKIKGITKHYTMSDIINLNLKPLKNNFRKLNKRGSILDVIIIMVFLVLFAITIPFIGEIYDDTATDLNESLNLNSSYVVYMEEHKDNYVSVWDGFFVFIFIGLVIGSLIGSALIRTFPALFVASIFLMVIVGVMSGYMANFYEDIVSDDDIAPYALAMPKTYFIMENYVLFITIVLVLDAIVMYSKIGGGD